MRKGIYEDHKKLRNYTHEQLYNLIKKNALAYLAQIVIKGLAHPHRDIQPLEAPGSEGGTSFDWVLMKHTMLCWRKVTVAQFGGQVVAIFENLCRKRGVTFNGLVAVPLFCCGKAKHFSMRTGQPLAAKSKEPSFTLACGKRALMTPLLTLSDSQPCWRCEDCVVDETVAGAVASVLEENPSAASSGIGKCDFRIFQVWPLVDKRHGDMHVPGPWQSKVTVMKGGAVEFMAAPPPPGWQWPNDRGERWTVDYQMQLRPVPKLGRGKPTTRFRFEDVDSDMLWQSSEKYEPNVA